MDRSAPTRPPSADAPHDPFGQQLLAFRLAARLTQEELAERSGLSARTISDLERGRRPAPHPVSANMLAAGLGLDDDARRRFFSSMRQHRRLRAEARIAADAAAADAPAPAVRPAILGRAAEIAAIAERIAAGERLITLLGPGGVGKTRLARAVADAGGAAGRRVLWVALDAISSSDLVMPAIARAAGAPVQGVDVDIPHIAAALDLTPTLLVLDNAEHLLDASAEIMALLASVPALTALVTSREALRVTFEHAVSVAPLPVPRRDERALALAANPAVTLFLHVLARAAPTRAARPDDPEHAAAIVRLLDGLPLAIELAAVQGAVLPLPAIATLLDTAGLAALARGRRDAPARFATMEAAIAWSTDLLSAEAQQLFRLLGVFHGGFTSESVIAVTAEAGIPHLVAALPRLAEAHLIEPDPAAPSGRLRMLEPVRLFALDRLRAAGEESAVRRAHAAHFLRWATAMSRDVAGPQPVPALDALDADLANLQAAFAAGDPLAALATAGCLSQYWEIRMRYREGRAALAATLAAAGAARPSSPDVMDAVFWSGYLAYHQSDLPAIDDALDRLRQIVGEDATPEYRARVIILDVLRGDAAGDAPGGLIPLGRKAHGLMADQPREVSWHMSTVILANLLVQHGDIADALPLLRDYADWARARGAAAHFNSANDWLGFTLLESGAFAEARARFAESIAWSADSGFLGTVTLPLVGYILAISPATAPREDLERAAMLMGALDAELARNRFPLGARNTAALDLSRARIGASLGAETVAGLQARGRDLDVEDALDLVRP